MADELVGVRTSLGGVTVEVVRNQADDGWHASIDVPAGAEQWRPWAISSFRSWLDQEQHVASARSPRDRTDKEWARSWHLHQIGEAFERALAEASA